MKGMCDGVGGEKQESLGAYLRRAIEVLGCGPRTDLRGSLLSIGMRSSTAIVRSSNYKIIIYFLVAATANRLQTESPSSSLPSLPF